MTYHTTLGASVSGNFQSKILEAWKAMPDTPALVVAIQADVERSGKQLVRVRCRSLHDCRIGHNRLYFRRLECYELRSIILA